MNTNLKVQKSGLWMDLDCGFLGASPDGIIKYSPHQRNMSVPHYQFHILRIT